MTALNSEGLSAQLALAKKLDPTGFGPSQRVLDAIWGQDPDREEILQNEDIPQGRPEVKQGGQQAFDFMGS